jgi:hypothetical protein
MWTTLAGLNWTTIAGVIGSVAPLITILIAVRALGSWKRTQRNQRIDECISAAYDLIGSFERYREVKSRHKLSTTAEAFDQLLTSFRDFDRAYTVVRRYRSDLDPKDPYRIQKFLVGLEEYDDDESRQKVDELIQALYDIIHIFAPYREPGRKTGALSRLVDCLRFALRRRRE